MLRFIFSVDKTFSNNSTKNEVLLIKNLLFLLVKAKMATTTKQNMQTTLRQWKLSGK